ncbi:hypothetical protein [Planctomicrobium piriforme]|uniref:Uncharacterized protein n=1 Tax=Planctomicrobium piriforme TaxID=1576369 RepID=A0A1I3EMU5_9PLAN|nr:hypothetical protein [Planctomicrobium piriforme]SFI00198.1 hypothetical protein SAMN05421753_104291 [Planctomicrobium piriforme]
MNLRSITLKVAGLLVLTAAMVGASRPQAVQAADPVDGKSTRIVVGLGSAQRVLDSLEYIVVELAGQKNAWAVNIKPNLEIFLYGVATDQPIRFDFVLDAEHGSQLQSIIPISDLKEFLNDNLDPIGITPTQDRKDKDLYELSGEVYEGWLRILREPIPYGIIFPQKEAIPKGMPHPQPRHKELAEKEYLAFLSLLNTAATMADRKAAFEKFNEVRGADFKKLSTETKEQFAFRKGMRDQTMSVLGQWIVESASILLGVKVDTKNAHAPTELMLSALPETALSADLKAVVDHSSQFAAVTPPEKHVLSGRIHLPVDEGRKAVYKQLYELARPVADQRIDADEKATASEKAGRKELVTLFLDLLTECMDKVPSVDALIDVIPTNDKHAMILAVGSTNAAQMTKIIEKLPSAKEGWKIEMNADKAGEVPLHKLSFGKNPPKSLMDFYGASNVVYFAVTDTAFWMAGGEGSLENLKSRLEAVAKSTPAKGDGLLLSFKMNTRPILKNLDDIMNDPELELLKQVNLKPRAQKVAEEKGETPKEEGRPGARAANLSNFKWQQTAIAAMDGSDDRFEVIMKVNPDLTLQGSADAQKGVLKALGAVIAKFADENLK